MSEASIKPSKISEDRLGSRKNSNILTDYPKIDLTKIKDYSSDEYSSSGDEEQRSPGQNYSHMMREHKNNFRPSYKNIQLDSGDGDTTRRIDTSHREYSEADSRIESAKLKKKRVSDFMLDPQNSKKESGFRLKDPANKSKIDLDKEVSLRFEQEDRKENSFADPLNSGRKKKSIFDMLALSKKPNRQSMDLTRDQINLIEDKNITEKAKKRLSISSNGERNKAVPNKFLDAISRIAAKRDSLKPENSSQAALFAQALIKINPNLLKSAENDLRWKGFRAFKKDFIRFFSRFIKVFSPDDEFIIFWIYATTLVIFFDILWTPFELSFYEDSRHTIFSVRIFTFLEIFFLLDIVVHFRTSYYDKGMIITDNKKVFMNYFRKGFFLDFLCVVCEMFGSIFYSTDTWYLKYFKILRARKMFYLIARTEDFMNLSRSVHATLRLIRLWMTILLVGHWIACLFHVIGKSSFNDQFTWLDAAKLADSPIFDRYIGAFYWAVMTMTTVGYGDVGPVSAVERAFCCCAMFVACVLFGYSMNVIGDILYEITADKNLVKEKMRSVKSYMSKKNLRRDLQIRVKNYLQYMIDSKNYHKNEEEELFRMLSQNLKDDIVSEANGKTLIDCKIFRSNFTQKCALHLSRLMEEKFLVPEELLFTECEEDPKNSMYFIQYGRINISLGGKHIIGLEQGSYVGEIEFFTQIPRTATARSHLFTTLFYLSRDEALEKIKVFPSDFEQFHAIKCNLQINDNFDQLDIHCFICNTKGHLARNCSKVHYVPDRVLLIQDYLAKEHRFRKSFKRKNRSKFSFRGYFREINACAAMIQEDYEDFTISDDDDLSQDSLDEILERNLFVIPGAEIEDMKRRRVDARRRSIRTIGTHHYHEDFIALKTFMGDKSPRVGVGDRSPRVEKSLTNLKDKDPNEIENKILETFLFFTIDKVENFEVYFPHNNVQRLIQDFEKTRMDNIESTPQGKMKAKFLKNIFAYRRNKLTPLQRNKTRIEDNVPVLNRIRTDMERITKQKKKERNMQPRSGTLVGDEKNKEKALIKFQKALAETIPSQKSKIEIESKNGQISSELLEDTVERRGDRLTSIEASQYTPINIHRPNLNQMNSNLSIRMPSNSKLQLSTLIPSGMSYDIQSQNKITNSLRINQLSVSEIPITPGESLRDASMDPHARMQGRGLASHMKIPSAISGITKISSIDLGKRASIDYNMFLDRMPKKTGSHDTPTIEIHGISGNDHRRLKSNFELGFEEALLVQIVKNKLKHETVRGSRYSRSASYSRMIEARFLMEKLKLTGITNKITQDVKIRPDLKFKNFS